MAFVFFKFYPACSLHYFLLVYSYLILSSRFRQLPEHSTTHARPMSSARFLQPIPLRNWNVFLVSNNKAAPCSLDSGEVFCSKTKRKQKHSRSYGEIFRCALCILGNLSAVRETEIILLGSILFSKAYLIVIPILTKGSKKLSVARKMCHNIHSFLFLHPKCMLYPLRVTGICFYLVLSDCSTAECSTILDSG